MRRYRVTLQAEYEIEAENAVEARLAMQHIRSIGERYSARMPGPHDRDFIRRRITRLSETKAVRRVSGRQRKGGR